MLARGDVVGDDACSLAIPVRDHAEVDLDVERGTIFATVLPLTHEGTTFGYNTLHVDVDALLIMGEQVVDSHAPEFLEGVAERALQRHVGIHPPAVRDVLNRGDHAPRPTGLVRDERGVYTYPNQLPVLADVALLDRVARCLAAHHREKAS